MSHLHQASSKIAKLALFRSLRKQVPFYLDLSFPFTFQVIGGGGVGAKLRRLRYHYPLGSLTGMPFPSVSLGSGRFSLTGMPFTCVSQESGRF